MVSFSSSDLFKWSILFLQGTYWHNTYKGVWSENNTRSLKGSNPKMLGAQDLSWVTQSKTELVTYCMGASLETSPDL